MLGLIISSLLWNRLFTLCYKHATCVQLYRITSTSQFVWAFPGLPEISLVLALKAPHPGKSLRSWQETECNSSFTLNIEYNNCFVSPNLHTW